MSTVAAARGQMRRDRGYSPAMLVEESRLFQVVTFQTLHRRQGELDQDQVLLDVMVIRGRGGFSAHAIRVLLGNATSSARSLGATLNSPRLSVGHDAAWYCPVWSSHFLPGPAPQVGQWTACICSRVGFLAFMAVEHTAIRRKMMVNFAQQTSDSSRKTALALIDRDRRCDRRAPHEPSRRSSTVYASSRQLSDFREPVR